MMLLKRFLECTKFLVTVRSPDVRLVLCFALLLSGSKTEMAFCCSLQDANTPPNSVVPLSGKWLLVSDPTNVGYRQEWFVRPVADAKETSGPSPIQEAYPDYHGVAWYWHDFVVPPSPQQHGRYLLRFSAVDYSMEAWVNGNRVGAHEGGETPFVFDVTDAVKPGRQNQLAVQVVDPPSGMKSDSDATKGVVALFPFWDVGGIVGPVELVMSSAVRIENLFASPDVKTGGVSAKVNVRNSLATSTACRLEFSISPTSSGEIIERVEIERKVPPGDTLVETNLRIANPRLWEINDPCLYRVSARVSTSLPRGIDEQSTRCGFRDFRFEDGYFRLNGRRIYLRSSHTANICPVVQRVPVNTDLLRRDLLNVKAMGFNAIRFIAGMAASYQLDLADEIGLMVYEESSAAWWLADSPKMKERFRGSIAEMIERDRNHPSLIIWGLLNENTDGPVFRCAVDSLPLVRSLDDTRLVMLNSGRWDRQLGIGSLSNPGSRSWECLLGGETLGAAVSEPEQQGYCKGMGDAHWYPGVPHSSATIQSLRTLGQNTKHVFLSEYGIGSSVDIIRVSRHYEQLGKDSAEDAKFYRTQVDKFMTDWSSWRMADTFASPEDYFRQCLKKNAALRTLGFDALRSNPNIISLSLTGTMDQGPLGEGFFTTFREHKPGMVDATFEGWAPLRLCLFAEPRNVYRGAKVKLEAVLANEDALRPGEYSVRLQVVGPGVARAFERTVKVTIPDPHGKPEPAFATPVFSEEVVLDGPPGQYRFLATFDKGAAATGGEVEFYVADRAELPSVDAEVVLWGEDAGLSAWLQEHGVRTRRFHAGDAKAREVILASSKPEAPGGAAAFRELARHMARGSNVIFLSPEVFAEDDDQTKWLPLPSKGALNSLEAWLYHKDEWSKRHPIFDQLPCGGLMDYAFYREIIPKLAWSGLESAGEVVVGAVFTANGYDSGVMMSVNKLGAGRFILNTLRVRENLDKHPAADRLLLNMLRYAATDAGKPIADVPAGFSEDLMRMGFQNK